LFNQLLSTLVLDVSCCFSHLVFQNWHFVFSVALMFLISLKGCSICVRQAQACRRPAAKSANAPLLLVVASVAVVFMSRAVAHLRLATTITMGIISRALLAKV
jgi:hypothetical protein